MRRARGANVNSRARVRSGDLVDVELGFLHEHFQWSVVEASPIVKVLMDRERGIGVVCEVWNMTKLH